MDFGTLVTVFISSMLVPWLAAKGLTLDPSQTAWLSGAVITTATAVVHFFETKFKMTKAAVAAKVPAPTTAAVIGLAKTTAPKSIVIVLALLAGGFVGTQDLTGCATTATGAAPSFNQLVSAAGQVDNTILTTVDSLVKSKGLTSAQAGSILNITDKVQAALTLANTAYAANDQATATAKLAAASAALASVQACLTSPATLPTCLQGVTAP